MGGDDQTLVDSAEQTHVTSAEQENDSVDNAQNVEDNSSRSEKLQNIANTVQYKGLNVPKICKEGTFALEGRSEDLYLLNSEFCNFVSQTFESHYKLPEEHATFKNSNVVPFKVIYNPKPSVREVSIIMPVKFVGFTDQSLKNDLKEAYKKNVENGWSNKYGFHLKSASSVNKKDPWYWCNWSRISPVRVKATIEEGGDHPSFYKVYYKSSYKYRDNTGPDNVTFSRRTLETSDQPGWQNVFAHEYGHQIGLDDEYAVDYYSGEYNGKTYWGVYWDRELKAYERSAGIRWYMLPKEGKLFNHNGVNYEAKKLTFKVGKDSKKGYVLKDLNSGKELEEPLKNLKSSAPVDATERNGKEHKAVYFYDVLMADEEPGLRTYDLHKIREKKTRLYHNEEKYSVHKRANFYYLVNEFDGKKRKKWLDGALTTHFDMVKEKFGEKYALENATMFDEKELGRKKDDYENEDYIMNGGNVVKPHHYIIFLKGMVNAIQSEYKADPSPKAPNMENDWDIKK